jgi:hypothetical protein
MDRRGSERRSPPSSEQAPRPAGDQVDVEQIMRDIRSRISQRHDIELTPQQIQELAARRLEAILDPRHVSPTLFDQLRKGAAAAPEPPPQAPDGASVISDEAIYEGGAVLRFFRRLFNPLLKLLFDPAPLTAAIRAQAQSTREAAARAAERERIQTEWNALHYQIVQRLVTEVSRNSIEVQSLATRVEALAARVDFNDRRVRSLESAPAPARRERTQEPVHHPAPATAESTVSSESVAAPVTLGVSPAPQSDGARRRRRRRRGRRGPTAAGEASVGATAGLAAAANGLPEGDEGGDDDLQEGADPVEAAMPDVSTPAASSVVDHAAPERIDTAVVIEPPPVNALPAAEPSPAPAADEPPVPAAVKMDPGAPES